MYGCKQLLRYRWSRRRRRWMLGLEQLVRNRHAYWRRRRGWMHGCKQLLRNRCSYKWNCRRL